MGWGLKFEVVFHSLRSNFTEVVHSCSQMNKFALEININVKNRKITIPHYPYDCDYFSACAVPFCLCCQRSNKNDKVDTSTIFYPQEGARLIQGQGS